MANRGLEPTICSDLKHCVHVAIILSKTAIMLLLEQTSGKLPYDRSAGEMTSMDG